MPAPKKTPRATEKSPWQDPGRQGEALQVEDFPSFLLTRLGGLAKTKLTGPYLAHAGLSWPEWRLLTILDHFSPMSYAALTKTSAMDKGQISLTLRILEARQWAQWDEAAALPAGAARKSARIVGITPLGRQIIRRVLPEAQRAQMRLLAEFSAIERAQFHHLLKKAILALQGITEAEPPVPE